MAYGSVIACANDFFKFRGQIAGDVTLMRWRLMGGSFVIPMDFESYHESLLFLYMLMGKNRGQRQLQP